MATINFMQSSETIFFSRTSFFKLSGGTRRQRFDLFWRSKRKTFFKNFLLQVEWGHTISPVLLLLKAVLLPAKDRMAKTRSIVCWSSFLQRLGSCYGKQPTRGKVVILLLARSRFPLRLLCIFLNKLSSANSEFFPVQSLVHPRHGMNELMTKMAWKNKNANNCIPSSSCCDHKLRIEGWISFLRRFWLLGNRRPLLAPSSP